MPTSEIDNKKITRERDIIVDFIPAVLKKTKSEGYLIEYHYKDKITNKLVRKRYYLNRVVNAYQKKSDGVNHARRIVHELNEKLKNGWTPIFETENQRLYTPILQLRDIYLNNKKRGLRADTMRSYTSMTNLFNEWIEGSNRSGKVTGNFLRYDAICYMDYVYDKGFSNRTYNNTLKGMRAFFSWAVEHCYCKENPFANIKMKTKEAKKRILIDEKSRKKISEYLRVKNPQFLIVCQLGYNSAMRPKEIANIQIKDIRLNDRYIIVREDNAKNGKARCATITAEVIEYLRPLIENLPDNHFLFGMNKDLLPDDKRCALSKFRKLWDDMRTKLNLPQEMQLYSLRDTGMIDLLHAGVDELSVQKHYDHSNLSIQAIYTNHHDPNLNERIFMNAPKF
ncbi:MAG: tyrosine-type recombinase/integrase [Bacteroidales bacterium]|nr:tyrosine-type recombinase/integrase [Bacteroidales bacterium]